LQREKKKKGRRRAISCLGRGKREEKGKLAYKQAKKEKTHMPPQKTGRGRRSGKRGGGGRDRA